MGSTLKVRVRPNQGFTLVELLVVIAIIGILMGLLIPAVNAARESARRAQCATQIKNLGLAAIQYENSRGEFPGYVSRFDFFEGGPDPADPGNCGGNVSQHPKRGTWATSLLPWLDAQPTYEIWSESRYPVRSDGQGEHPNTEEDYSSMDSAPLIGWSSSIGESYLVATGFNAWGISNGTVAGIIIAELSTGHEHPWSAVFDAARHKPIAGGAKFVKGNVEVAAHLVSGYLSRKPKTFDELTLGDAAIMSIDGKNIAAFKDEHGSVHAVSAVCSHMGCIVGWNETDRTWDCPCHGSRFELSGEVIHGPATQPLGHHITG